VQPDGTISSANVTTGETLGGLVSLKSGPPPGTKVIEKPSADLHAGMHVKEKQP